MKVLLIFAMLIMAGAAIAQEPPTWVDAFGNVHTEDGTTWRRDAFVNWISDDGTVCREDAFGDWYCERKWPQKEQLNMICKKCGGQVE